MPDEGTPSPDTNPPANADNGTSQGPPDSGSTGDSISLPRSEYDRFQRYEQQIKGMRPLVDAAQKLGIKKPEDFDRYSRFKGTIDRFSERDLSDRDLDRIFGGRDDFDDDTTGQPINERTIQKLLDERLGKIENESKRGIAETEHRRLQEREQDYITNARETLAKELFGDGADEWNKYLFDEAFENYLWRHRKAYPEDHPLSGHEVRPFTDKEVADLAKSFANERKSRSAQQLAEIGDAAQKQAASPPAGKSRGQGQADKETPKEFDELSREEQMAWLEKRQKQRGATSA